MLSLKIDKEEAQFEIAVCDYYATRARLGVSEEQIKALLREYTESWRQARGSQGPRIEWGAGGDPEMLDLIERRRNGSRWFNYLHWAWLRGATDWGKSLDGLLEDGRSFSEQGRIFEIRGLATWFVNGSRDHGVGPVRGVFELDLATSKLVDYTISFLDRENPEGRLYRHRAEVSPPSREEDWLFVFRKTGGECVVARQWKAPGD